ncbi:hypothetical protein CPB83DRAFT_777475 [Crepidotus variabilis]|uniref:DUF1996 domain-containing protein n=1 Tax=Crepidotus variabilis TaxID=179855 RepID=A0A9P6JII4_9AGAR|nr:hypothetical protein CPB83DRAFT_777475 [Crepidotus variabilis]
MKLTLSLGIASLSALHANALIRFGCSQLVTERFDPLVTPGQVSPHLHQIVGGVGLSQMILTAEFTSENLFSIVRIRAYLFLP